MAKSLLEISELIENTKFKHKLIGGADELDVWAKIERLHKEYMELLGITQQRAFGAVNEWQEYAEKLAEEIQEKDERIFCLSQQVGINPMQQTHQDQACSPPQTQLAGVRQLRIPTDRGRQSQRVIRVQKAGAAKRQAGGHKGRNRPIEPERILSAEEIRRMYDDGNPAQSGVYG